MNKKEKYLVGCSKTYTYCKPNAKKAAIISKNIEIKKMDAEEIKKALMSGYSIRPAIFNGDNFIFQQIFFVDVDNDKRIRTVDKNLQICKKMGLAPMLAYATFSFDSKNQKHRLVFATKEPVINLNERSEIVRGLNKIFCGDSSTENMKRFFYPGKLAFFYNPFEKIKNSTLREAVKSA